MNLPEEDNVIKNSDTSFIKQDDDKTVSGNRNYNTNNRNVEGIYCNKCGHLNYFYDSNRVAKNKYYRENPNRFWSDNYRKTPFKKRWVQKKVYRKVDKEEEIIKVPCLNSALGSLVLVIKKLCGTNNKENPLKTFFLFCNK
jgi:hypothetical protein